MTSSCWASERQSIAGTSGSNISKKFNKENCDFGNMDEISTDLEHSSLSSSSLKHLPHWPPVNLEFQDLTYTVPDITKGKKRILRSITGHFRANQLTAILGPSGSGKTTLLNILAGYNCSNITGQVFVNGKPRDMNIFYKMARYIMQDDIVSQHLTVREAMMIAADLKLGSDLTKQEKNQVIDEILSTLRLKKAQNTRGERLSGGEKKRLSVGLELINNPPLIFLDEPTTGLDDLASSQCISLLRKAAHAGQSIICSIHTPSAKVFEMFDHVYIISDGQCVYQGSGSHIVTYVQNLGLSCPITYNPADFIIEVSCGEYGYEYVEKMVTAVDNGRCKNWTPLELENSYTNDNYSKNQFHDKLMDQFEEEINLDLLKSRSTWWQQFKIILRRKLIEMWRNTAYIKLKFWMTIILGFVVGGIYQGVGNDATKALFNFGFAFTICIAYLYKPLMPVLLEFPTEVRLLKREYFNRWYQLSPYYCAMVFSKLPIQFFLSLIYLTMIYFMSNQPIEIDRIIMVYTITFLVAMNSDSLGVLLASRFNIVNAMFVGPVISVPLILLSCYGIGSAENIPGYMRFVMSFSYLRYGLEGIMAALYGNNRADTICPDEEVFCIFQKTKFLLYTLGFENIHYSVAIYGLVGYYIVFTLAAFYMIKSRLKRTESNYVGFQYIGQFVKTHLNFSSY